MMLRLTSLLAVILFVSTPAPAQSPCTAPRLPQSTEPNIFSPQQEMDLADAIAEHVQRDFRMLDDDEIRSYLQKIGDRLAAKLPPQHFRFRFFVVDEPVTNAWTVGGGRVYVTRKMIALAQSEDELAGVLGHEMGHVLAPDMAIRMTEYLRIVLNVTQVSDRKDIFEKYHLFLENWKRRVPEAQPAHFSPDSKLVVFHTSGLRVERWSVAELGRVFGSAKTVSANGKWLAVQNQPGQLLVYDLATMAEAAAFTFSSPVSFAQFSSDAKRLFALTSSQAGYFLDATRLAAPQSAGAQR